MSKIHIDSGKQEFGPDYEWDYTKRKAKQLSLQSTHSVCTNTRRITITNNCNYTWFSDVLTLVDSGGCESCINVSFAYSNNFAIFDDKLIQKQSPAISACGGQIYFNKYVKWKSNWDLHTLCLLYTSDAADE